MKRKNKIILRSSLSTISAILFTGVLVGTYFADHYSNTINGYFGCKTYEIVNVEEDEVDSKYFKSEYVKEDGEFDYEGLWEKANDVCRTVAEEGATLLWQKDNALPLKAESSISLFGQRSVDWAYVTGGSASTSPAGSPSLRTTLSEAEFDVNKTLWSFYEKGNGAKYRGQNSRKINEVPWSEYDESVKSSFKKYGDAAVIVLGRLGGENDDLDLEDSDGIDGSYLDISAQEKEMIEEVISYKNNNTFNKVILVIASDHAISMKNILPFKNSIDACLWVGSAGRQSAPALTNLLSGKANPSGNLPDTYLFDSRNIPATANFGDYTYGNADKYPELMNRVNAGNREASYIVYQEGIYSGYRYFETRYEDYVTGNGNAKSKKGSIDGNERNYSKEVAFPFGYNQSYTTFDVSGFKVNHQDDKYEVSVDVKNTGDYAGKKAIQIYMQRPYTDYDKANQIEKSAIELVGFEKSQLIEPGETKKVTVTIDEEVMRTYDAIGKGTYILEKGDYHLAFGENAHDALNNVLNKKGFTKADGMDAEGNKDFVYTINVKNDDFEKYSIADTGEKIVNQFDSVDLNRYKNKKENSVTYLSRKDWDGTYPLSTVQITLNDDMVNDLDICKKPVEDEGAENYKFVYGEDNGRKLVEMRGLPFDHELWQDLLDQTTLEEQVILNVKGSLSTAAVSSVFAPPTYDFDGPMGLRKYTLKGTTTQLCFPSAVVQGATMNKDLIQEVGDMFAETMLHAGYNVLYAPACNIHRSAFSARNSEYYSEDPYLNGIMAARCVIGAQKKGALLTVKHFALNDQDFNRYAVGVWCNENSMRELFIKPFEIATRVGDPLSFMTSYNRIGTTWTGGSYQLITEVLREEWGFRGFVVSDAWSSSNIGAMNYIDGLMAGNDVEFTSGTYNDLKPYLDSPTVKKRLRDSTHRTLYAIANSNAMNGLTSSSQIRLLTTWWQYGIVGIDIGVGILFAASLTMLMISIFKKSKPKVTVSEK